MRINRKKTEKAIEEVLNLLKEKRLSVTEMVIVLGQVLINVGYTIYFKIDREGKVPPGNMDGETARKLMLEDPTLGSMLMRLGFDFQGGLLQSLKERGGRKV